jgi:hypothetical protein
MGRRLFVLLVLVGALVAAGTAQSPGVCDPLVPQYCLFPFPNDFYLAPDATTPTGGRVVIPDAAAPVDRNGAGFSMEIWSRLDGWSVGSVAMAVFPNVSLGLSRVPGWQDLARSLAADAPTALLDLETGELLPHFAELDETSGVRACATHRATRAWAVSLTYAPARIGRTQGSGQQAFMLWPVRQLKFGRRYAVAMRNLVTDDGTAIAPSPAFQALRDGTPTSDPDIEGRRALYEVRTPPPSAALPVGRGAA